MAIDLITDNILIKVVESLTRRFNERIQDIEKMDLKTEKSIVEYSVANSELYGVTKELSSTLDAIAKMVNTMNKEVWNQQLKASRKIDVKS